MAAFNDNVVFTDTSNDAITWQRVRLLTLLDLPRPEVLMNVWSYQASSPDGKEIMRSAERVRGLVAAHNDALEDSIQYGWSYLSREMAHDLRSPRITAVIPNAGVAAITIEGDGFGPGVPGVNLEPIPGVSPSSDDPKLTVKIYKPYSRAQQLVAEGELQPPARAPDSLTAEIPAGVMPGWYMLTVTNEETHLTGRMKVNIANGDTEPQPPAPEPTFFDRDFYDYVTQKFVADPPGCSGDPERTDQESTVQEKRDREAKNKCLNPAFRKRWGFCPAGKYCLGFTQAFQPLKPNLTTILLGAIASQHPLKTILTTIACMEGKWEVYSDACFPGRSAISQLIHAGIIGPVESTVSGGGSSPFTPKTADVVSPQATCLHDRRAEILRELRSNDRMSCGRLDEVALQAQEQCGVAQSFPMSCFTIQAAQSFSSQDSFSTFPLEELNELAEQPIANAPFVEAAEKDSAKYGTTRIGLLRAAIADFLFNYKMAQEFPQDFVPYDLQHSAQELNAELNPMVVAFNQDVAAFSHHLSDHLESDEPNRNHFFQLWRNRKSFLSDGIITVRGIGGIYSTVDTITQNYFDATQAQSLSTILSTLTGQSNTAGGPASSPSAALTALQSGALNATTGIAALAALVPPTTQARIGRDLSFYVTPYTLPGASSAELQVQLTAAEDAPPNLFQAGNATGSIDPLSRVAEHNVTTRVRVESIKLFELSSFSALIQRPRSKFPLIPPLIELPFIGSIASLPLPGAKEYHRSTAIVSAVIVPTAADLAYGINFAHDRLLTKETSTMWGHDYEMRSVSSLTQFQSDSQRMPIRAFHKAMVNCFATNGGLPFTGGERAVSPAGCATLDFRRVPPEF